MTGAPIDTLTRFGVFASPTSKYFGSSLQLKEFGLLSSTILVFGTIEQPQSSHFCFLLK